MFVGGVTPPIDGITVIVEDITSQPDSFTVNVATTPGSGLGGPVSPAPQGAGDPLAWWAEDDRGGVYLGATTNWGGGPDHARGTVQFAPAIDPHCRELRLLPTGTRVRRYEASTFGYHPIHPRPCGIAPRCELDCPYVAAHPPSLGPRAIAWRPECWPRQTVGVTTVHATDEFTAWIEELAIPHRAKRAFWHLVISGPDALPATRRGLAHSNPQVRDYCTGVFDHLDPA
jgi:hypothetical protein